MPRRKFKTGVHAHGCPRCKGRFEDACDDPAGWYQCADCRTGRSVLNSLLIRNRLPIKCCRANSRPVRKDEIDSYRLYQDCPWLICTTCKRTFPFSLPLKENSDA